MEIIDMPKLSDTMTVGTVVRWLKKEGDVVAPGDMLAEIETDKATMELENFSKGTLLKQYVQVGDQIPIGAALCAIGKPGEAIPDAPAKVEDKKAVEAIPAPDSLKVENSVVSLGSVLSSNLPLIDNSRIKASPLAKKIAQKEQVSLNQLLGTGPGGRIIKADILAYLSAGGSHAMDFSANTGYQPQLMDKVVPVSGLRSTIARRLVESKVKNPHFYLEVEVDVAGLEDLRKSLNHFFAENAQNSLKLTINDLILRATALALAQVPAVNASWNETVIQQHGGVHLAFGVAIEDGLVTPVIRDAHKKSLQTISMEAKALVGKARAKKLKPDEMNGSTFTVTNLGMFGISSFYGIINPPNAGILSVGGTFKKPIVNERDEIVVGQRMLVGFSGDHRVIDGAVGAQFLGKLKYFLESPALLVL